MARRNFHKRGLELAQAAGRSNLGHGLPSLQGFREEAIHKAEISYLNTLMDAVGGNIAKACMLSGLSRSRLYDLLKRHSIGTN